MAAKFGDARRRAFLATLPETGNRTLAAERAEVSRSWVRKQQGGDPGPGRAVDVAAVAATRCCPKRLSLDPALPE